MTSMQNTLKCPHCFVDLEVSALISRLSLRWVDGEAKAPTQTVEAEAKTIPLPSPPRQIEGT